MFYHTVVSLRRTTQPQNHRTTQPSSGSKLQKLDVLYGSQHHYNHIFMTLLVQKEMTKRLHQEILDFLWTKQHDGETIQKRRLVAKDRIPAHTKLEKHYINTGKA
jgi:hypothetical protein